MRVDPKQIQELRNRTGVGVMDCKRTLEESDGDFNKALILLQDLAAKKAEKKAERVAAAGVVDSYIHGDGRIGVLIEVHCETDFLAKSADFRSLVRDLALQIASQEPQYLAASDVPPAVIAEIEHEAEQKAMAMGKSNTVANQIKAGKVQKFCEQVCLLEQTFIKDPGVTISGLIQRFTAKCGERVQIAYFIRRQIA